MFDQLSSLDTTRTSWRIKVRLTRMWPSISSTPDAVYGLKGYYLILLDDDNYHVHAFVYAENWKTIFKDMEEGALYIISNFYTKEASGTLKPTSSRIIINFSNSTHVQKLPINDFMIPKHKFEFIDLSDLFNVVSAYENENNPEFATDIIGVLENFENVKSIKTMYGDRNIVKFQITDGRYSHKVTVWGQLAVKIDEEYEKIVNRPLIVIVTSAKMKKYKSSVKISTLPSSKLYLDLDDDSVVAMRIRLEEEGYKPPEIVLALPMPDASPTPVIETITLAKLSQKTATDHLKMKFLTLVKVSTIEKAENWWFFGCPDCYNEALKLDGRFKCMTCPKCIHLPHKRYKIVCVAGDSSETFTFILMDKAAKRIIGRSASKLSDENKKLEGTSEYPSIIQDIVGKELNFQIEIGNDNVLFQSKIFNVIDAYDIDFFTSSPANATTSGFSDVGISENAMELSISADTPGSANSISKKPKMEK